MLLFRDNAFIGLDSIPEAHRAVNEIYGHIDGDPDYAPPGLDLVRGVPISHFMGSWHVLACGAQTVTTRSDHPVFLAFHDVMNLLCQGAGGLWTGLGWATRFGGQALIRSHGPPRGGGVDRSL